MLRPPRLDYAVTAAICLSLALARAQTSPDSELNLAYRALAAKQYDAAIAAFHKGLALQPSNAKAHKDLAYTLLKTGDNAEARDEFGSALQLDPHDDTAALEFAFLAYETKKPIEARRAFDRLRHSSNAATRATAAQAFTHIDQPLADSIARWQQALSRVPDPNALSTFSAHWELAQSAELRDELPLAAEQFAICRQLKPQLPELLLILARVWGELERAEDSHAAWLAASRSADSRTAELALEHLGGRYPYPYEFAAALKLDPKNLALRKELAYLYLAMHKNPEAIEQFQTLVALDPKDQAAQKQLDQLHGLTASVATPASTARSGASVDAKTLGKKSLAMGYLHDAIKYLQQAHEQDPDDADVMLQLGWAYNQSKDDASALDWFDRARRAGDGAISAEASRAFHNLRGDVLPQTTIWTLPMFSTRWKDAFSYGQIKRTVPIPGMNQLNRLVSFYLFVGLDGDIKGGLPSHVVTPQYLSETSVVVGAGVASQTWHHFTGFAEAGESLNYLPSRRDLARAVPAYRVGLDFTKGFGHLLGSKNAGLFLETIDDAVYNSRFDKDTLFSTQNRAGETFHIGTLSAQAVFNINYERDLKREDWANFVEIGPGMRFHAPWMPPAMFFATDFLHGFYTMPSTRKDYNDLRVSVWYAVTK